MRINPIDPSVRAKDKRKENDEKYLIWLRKQRSAYSNKSPCIAAHFRTAKNSGIGIKPLYSAIPLTATEHDEQHRVGQFKFASRNWWEQTIARYQWLYQQQTGMMIPGKYIIV